MQRVSFKSCQTKADEKPALPAPSYSSPINKREHSHMHHALCSFINVLSFFRSTMKKNKLLLCFRPLTDDPVITHPADSDLLVHSNDKSRQSSKLKSEHEGLKITQRRSRSLNASSNNFCNDLKSVLVEASMQQKKQRSSEENAARLILRSKSHHDSINSNKSLARVGSVGDNSVPMFSKSLISETEHRPSLPFAQMHSLTKSQMYQGAKSKSLNSGLVIFATSLCATIFCGRVCAILFTLILFCCVPRRNCVDRRLKNVLKLPEETEKEYKKRVIIEGLLERNHHLCRGRVIN